MDIINLEIVKAVLALVDIKITDISSSDVISCSTCDIAICPVLRKKWWCELRLLLSMAFIHISVLTCHMLLKEIKLQVNIPLLIKSCNSYTIVLKLKM